MSLNDILAYGYNLALEKGHAAGGAALLEHRLLDWPRGVEHLAETGPLSQGVQARRKALRIRHINGMEVRKKRPTGPGGPRNRPRGFKCRAP